MTWLGLWGAMRGFLPVTCAILVSIAFLESLTAPVAQFFSSVPLRLIHVFAVGIGLLLGLVGYFAGDSWDLLFEMFYGPKGRWLDAAKRPLLVFPPGATLKRLRNQAVSALPRRPETDDEVYREAVKLARRQVERWEGIERPLTLSRFMRGLLWPCLFAAILALCGAGISLFADAASEASRLVGTAAGCLMAALACLVPYSSLRVEHMVRLYEDVAGHAPKKRPERR